MREVLCPLTCFFAPLPHPQAEIERFQALVRPRTPVQLKYFDLDGLLDSITQADNLKELGIFITDRSCVQLEPFALDELEVESVCKQPAQYVFYDPFHYTSTIHREVAKGIAKALDGKGTDKSCKDLVDSNNPSFSSSKDTLQADAYLLNSMDAAMLK
eukprot:scaffold233445_cov24-Tisochrysis_lutea.AAC.1